ncbi:MAG: hypothetical protein ACMUIE_01760 [Thermoplasmatota archaeon]
MRMDDTEKVPGNEGSRKILNPATWLILSIMLWGLVIIPLSIAAFYIFEVAIKLFDQGNQYSVLYGSFVGLILTIIVAYFYASRARKIAE